MALAATLVVCAPPAASAADPARSSGTEELWRAFPLDPADAAPPARTTRAPAARAPVAARPPARARQVTKAQASSGRGRSWEPWWLLLLLVPLGVAGWLAERPRRRRAALGGPMPAGLAQDVPEAVEGSVRDVLEPALREARSTGRPLCVVLVSPRAGAGGPPVDGRGARRALLEALDVPALATAVTSERQHGRVWLVVRGALPGRVRVAAARAWPVEDDAVEPSVAAFPDDGRTAEDLMVACRLGARPGADGGRRRGRPGRVIPDDGLGRLTPARRFERRPAPEPDSPAERHCEITWVSGSPEGRFVAVEASGRRGHGVPVAASAPLRRPPGRQPEATGSAMSAVAGLVDGLLESGWEVTGRGRAWYAHRFTLGVPRRPASPAAAPPGPRLEERDPRHTPAPRTTT